MTTRRPRSCPKGPSPQGTEWTRCPCKSRFRPAEQGVALLLAALHVLQRNGCAKADLFTAQGLHVDDIVAGHARFDEVDARLHHALALARGVVAAVLAQVAFLAGQTDGLGNLRALLFQAVQLLLHELVAFLGNGNARHVSTPLMCAAGVAAWGPAKQKGSLRGPSRRPPASVQGTIGHQRARSRPPPAGTPPPKPRAACVARPGSPAPCPPGQSPGSGR